MKADRDIEKLYPKSDFIAELRRLAEALEKDEPFEIHIADELILAPARAVVSIEHEREEGREEIEFQLHWRRQRRVPDSSAAVVTKPLKSLAGKGKLEASPGIEPRYTDLQSAA